VRVIGDLSRLSARRYPSKAALMMGDRHLTYADIDGLSNRLAHALISKGIQPGDRVALLAQNRLDYGVITQAVAKCGAILVTVNFRFVASEIRFVIENSGCKLLFYEEPFSTSIASVMPDLSTKPELVVLADEGPSSPTASPSGCYRGLMMSQNDNPPDVEVDAQSAATIMYTSGTTGFPKGVMYSHAGYFRLFISNLVELELGRHDVFHIVLPMFHNAGLNGAFNSMMLIGASGVVHRGSFDPETILAEIERYRITAAHWAPTMLAMLCNYEGFSRFDVSSLTKINYGGMPIEVNVLRRAEALFSAKFYQVYGATECGTVTVLRPEDHVQWPQAAGREAFNAESRVVDEHMRDVPVGGVGEVIVRARDNGMLGYWNNPAATAETIRDGWIHTGDLARVEPDSLLTIVGRMQEVIISGSENIYAREVESVLARHPAIQEVAVFGIPDAVFGEKVCAAIAVRSGAKLSEQELEQFCLENMARYKRPRVFEFHPELPKNSAGKITKAKLRDVHWASRERSV